MKGTTWGAYFGGGLIRINNCWSLFLSGTGECISNLPVIYEWLVVLDKVIVKVTMPVLPLCKNGIKQRREMVVIYMVNVLCKRQKRNTFHGFIWEIELGT